MENREAGLIEIYTRIKNYKTSGLLSDVKTFKRSPTSPIEQTDLPCIFMIEDVDTIINRSNRSELGYPATRTLEVILEIVTGKSTDIKTLYRKVRTAVLTGGAKVGTNIFVNEIRTEGPTGYGLTDVLGMRLVLAMTYMDAGI